jgi:hypothetical protein
MTSQDKRDFVIDGLGKMVDARNRRRLALRTTLSSDSSDITGFGAQISRDGTNGSDNRQQHQRSTANNDQELTIVQVQEIKKEFYDKLLNVKAAFKQAEQTWKIVDGNPITRFVDTLSESVALTIESYKFYNQNKRYLASVPSPFTKVGNMNDSLAKFTVQSVLADPTEQLIMKNVIYDYFNTSDANENFCQRGTKRDMNTAARDIQEMIAGSELCVGTKLCSTMRTLEDTAYLSTPQPYYGPIPEDKKHEQLSPFGAASVVYAIVAVHNVNVSLVVHNHTESDDGDVPVVTSKHLQRGIVYVPVFPFNSTATQIDKRNALNLLHSQMGNIKDSLKTYIETNGLQTQNKNIMCSDDKLDLIQYFTGKSDTQRIHSAANTSARKKRGRQST